VAGRPATVPAHRSGLVKPKLPTPTDDVSDPLVAGLTGGELRASAHGISHLTVKRIGRKRSVVEHPINTSSVEPSGLVLRPCNLAARTRRVIYDEPRDDVGVDIARHIDRGATPRSVAPRVPIGGRLSPRSSCRPTGISTVGGHSGVSARSTRLVSRVSERSVSPPSLHSPSRSPCTPTCRSLARPGATPESRHRAPSGDIRHWQSAGTRYARHAYSLRHQRQPLATSGNAMPAICKVGGNLVEISTSSTGRRFRGAAGDASVMQCRSATSTATQPDDGPVAPGDTTGLVEEVAWTDCY
jgi:hypothetical protein